MKLNLLLLFLLLTTVINAQTIQGKTLDKVNREGLPFVNVILEKEGLQIAGTTSDLDGNYILTGFDPGVYDIRVVYVGYQQHLITDINVGASKTVPLDIEMEILKDSQLSEIQTLEYKTPLIVPDYSASGSTVTAEEVMEMPVKNDVTIVKGYKKIKRKRMPPSPPPMPEEEINEIILEDSVRTRKSNVASIKVEEVKLISGGLPAQFENAKDTKNEIHTSSSYLREITN